MTSPEQHAEPLRLSGYVRLAEHGFALPVYDIGPGANASYFAIPSIDGDHLCEIAGFELAGEEEIQPLAEPIGGIRIHDPWLDIFLWAGSVFAGRPAQIYAAVAPLRDDMRAVAPLSFLDLAIAAEAPTSAELTGDVLAFLKLKLGEVAGAATFRSLVLRAGVQIALRRQFRRLAVGGESLDISRDFVIREAEGGSFEVQIGGGASPRIGGPPAATELSALITGFGDLIGLRLRTTGLHGGGSASARAAHAAAPRPFLKTFLRELQRQARLHESTGKIDFNVLSGILRDIDDVTIRVEALQCYLAKIPVLPARTLIDVVVGSSEDSILHQIKEGGKFELACATISMFRTSKISDRAVVLEQYHKDRPDLNPTLENLAGSAVRHIADLRELVDRILNLHLRPSRNLFWGASRKLAFSDVPAAIELMKQNDVRPDIGIFKSFSQSTRSFDHRFEILSIMDNEDVGPDESFFQNLAEVAVTTVARRSVLDAIRRSGLRPDVKFFQSFVQSAQSFDDGMHVLQLMVAEEVRPNAAVFKHIAEKAKTPADRSTLLAAMRMADVTPDVAFFQSLVQSDSTLRGRWQVLDIMSAEGVTPNVPIFKNIAEKSKEPQDRQRLLETMLLSNVRPDVTFFQTFVQSGETLEERLQILEIMRTHHVRPNSAVFKHIAERARAPEDQEMLLEIMRVANVQPDAAFFESLIQGASSFEDRLRALDRMNESGVRTGAGAYLAALQLAGSPSQGNALLARMESDGMAPKVSHLSAVVGSCSTYAEAKEYIDRIDLLAGKPAIGDLLRLLRRAPDVAEAETIYSQIEGLAFSANRQAFGLVLDMQPDARAALHFMRERLPAELEVDVGVANTVFQKCRSLQDVLLTIDAFSGVPVHVMQSIIPAIRNIGLTEPELALAFRRLAALGIDVTQGA